MKIFQDIEISVQSKLPFVVYLKPNESLIRGIFQRDDKIYFTKDYSESGFVFAPFDNHKKSILIPINNSTIVNESVTKEDFDLKKTICKDELSKEFYVNIVDKAIKEIEKNQLKKVVLSRKETVELVDFDLILVFKKLLYSYPNALVYVWFHPKVGLWLGATPEILLKHNDSEFETMSLAGTQLYKETDEVYWSEKEIEEQQFVTDYIVEKLSEVCKSIQKNKMETAKAGPLLHLKTKITGKLKIKKLNLKNLINALHPTPAVCGLPKVISKKFITENENYNRSFYTGFLGELNFELKRKQSYLFVNLRCMEIKNKKANIYIGSGITKESNPTAEWEETIAKSEVMKKVL